MTSKRRDILEKQRGISKNRRDILKIRRGILKTPRDKTKKSWELGAGSSEQDRKRSDQIPESNEPGACSIEPGRKPRAQIQESSDHGARSSDTVRKSAAPATKNRDSRKTSRDPPQRSGNSPKRSPRPTLPRRELTPRRRDRLSPSLSSVGPCCCAATPAHCKGLARPAFTCHCPGQQKAPTEIAPCRGSLRNAFEQVYPLGG